MEKIEKNKRLTPNDIEARIESVNEYGARVIFYKNARVDMAQLDARYGAMNWQNSYRDVGGRLIAVIEIWDDDKKCWIHKENAGEKNSISRIKSEASDAFKRTGTVWGIGRELYKMPKIIIPKEKLISYKAVGDLYECHDEIIVEDISYNEDEVVSITLTNHFGGQFNTTSFKKQQPQSQQPTIKEDNPEQKAKEISPQSSIPDYLKMNDDEEILFGELKGKVYGEVKNSKEFKNLLSWTLKIESPNMTGPKREQFTKLRELALSLDLTSSNP